MAVMTNMFDIFFPHRQVAPSGEPFFEQCLEKPLFITLCFEKSYIKLVIKLDFCK